MWGAGIGGLKSGIEFARVSDKIMNLHEPRATIFGSSLIHTDDPYTAHAYTIANELVKKGWTILTGGGPGIMQAGNCGAFAAEHDHSLGIGVKGVDETFENVCAPVVYVSLFATRKELLTKFSKAYIFLPGGVGTADELFDLLNSVKHGLIPRHPIVLFGKDFWEPFVVWYKYAVQCGYIKQKYADLFMVTDNIDAVVSYICSKADV